MQQSVAAQAPEARVDGIIVQPMATPGVEVIIGMSKDATFGPVLMFGLGGVLVEVLKDVTFRIVPLSQRDASEMIHDIQASRCWLAIGALRQRTWKPSSIFC